MNFERARAKLGRRRKFFMDGTRREGFDVGWLEGRCGCRFSSGVRRFAFRQNRSAERRDGTTSTINKQHNTTQPTPTCPSSCHTALALEHLPFPPSPISSQWPRQIAAAGVLASCWMKRLPWPQAQSVKLRRHLGSERGRRLLTRMISHRLANPQTKPRPPSLPSRLSLHSHPSAHFTAATPSASTIEPLRYEMIFSHPPNRC